jgi:hypothetical protein
MGPHLMRRPPKFVQGFIDCHGKARFYFRRTGFKAVPPPGLPWWPEFMAAYAAALAGQAARALAVSYFTSVAFRSIRSTTQSVYRNIIEKFCSETDKAVATLQPQHIVKLMAEPRRYGRVG